MISRQFITDLSTKYQTSEQNIAREYCQHLFLSYLYRLKGGEKMLFKGGTALRIVFQSPRFSCLIPVPWELRIISPTGREDIFSLP